LNIVVSEINQELHNSYISKLKKEDLKFDLSYFLVNTGHSCWVDSDGSYFILINSLEPCLLCPPITLSGEYDYEKAKFYLDEYNLNIITKLNALKTSHKNKKVPYSNTIIYDINKAEFFALKGKKYTKYRSILNKIKRHEYEFKVLSFTAGDDYIPSNAIKSVIVKWKETRNLQNRLFVYLNNLKNINNNLKVNIFIINNIVYGYTIYETLRDDYYFILDRKHILRRIGGKNIIPNFDAGEINFWLHYEDIKSIYKDLNTDSDIVLNIGGADKKLTSSKIKLRNETILKTEQYHLNKNLCKITFTQEEKKSVLISLF